MGEISALGRQGSRKMGVEREYENICRNALKEIGETESVKRFLSNYGNWRTKAIFACELRLYLRHLKGLGVGMTSDKLITDNLQCVSKSDPIDVKTKRRHTDWLSGYVNDHLLKGGSSDAHRELLESVIKTFYKRNDSPLFEDFGVALQPLRPPCSDCSGRSWLMAVSPVLVQAERSGAHCKDAGSIVHIGLNMIVGNRL